MRGKLLDGSVGLALQRLIPAHTGKTGRARRRPSARWAHPRSRGENQVGCQRLKQVCGSSPLTRGKQVPVRWPELGAGLIPTHAGKTFCVPAIRAWTRAHPHSCGENEFFLPSHLWMWGSSPLTRGKQWWDWRRRGHVGLIPAHAGKTGSRSCRLRPSTAHPHSCRENVRLPSVLRGAGLIPAHAGKTSCSSPSRPSTRAHPRSRGETLTERELVVPTLGSSPLTRGKLLDLAGRARDRGLIPAHAGKTWWC